MNILLVGSGGREHALAWKISQSNLCKQLYIAPGNPGTAQCGINVEISAQDIQGLRSFWLETDITLVVIGPEAPLVDGITDAFRTEKFKHIGIVGPSAYAAQLEGSKAFTKKFMQKYNHPGYDDLLLPRSFFSSPVMKPQHVLFSLAFFSSLHAANWPEWRGPDGQGQSQATQLPETWSETSGVAWKAEIPGRGHSTPLVWGDLLWLTTALEKAATPDQVKARLATNRRSTADRAGLRQPACRAVWKKPRASCCMTSKC